MRQTIKNLVALTAALAAGLALGEALLRLVVALPQPLLEPEVRHDPHPIRRFTLRPGQRAFTGGVPATIDADGFRSNGSPVVSSSTATTVFTLGDSFTFGLGVRDEETWPARLEARLRSLTTQPVSVVNGGTISYGVFQEMDLFKSAGLARQPSVVIHALYWDDFMNAAPPDLGAASPLTPDGLFVWNQPDNKRGALTTAASWLTGRSALFFSLRQTVAQIREQGVSAYGNAYTSMLQEGLTAGEWAPIDAFYDELQTLGRLHGFTPFVLIMPISDIVSGREVDQHPYAVEARRRLDAREIPYVDAFQVWEDGGYHSRFFRPPGPDAHLDSEGYEVIVNAMVLRMLSDPQISRRFP